MTKKKTGKVVYGKFSGINNQDPAERLKEDELREATNVDIDNTNRASRRKGYTKKYTGTNTRSLWSDGTTCLFAEENSLKELNSDYTATTLRSDLTVNSEVSYTGVNSDIYYSDGSVTGIFSGGVDRAWGIDVPPNQPTITATNGTLDEGDYQVAVSYQASDGRESGAVMANTITLAQGQGISLTNIPNSSDTTVTKVNIYCSPANGDKLYLADQIDDGTTTHVINGGTWSIPLRTQFVTPAPAGSIVAYSDGRMYIAVGKYIYYSDAFAHEWFRLATNFYAFSEDITMMVPVDGGLYVSADATYWISGSNPNEASSTEVSESKAVKRTAVEADAAFVGDGGTGKVQLWMSDQGACIGRPGGTFEIATEGKYSVSGADIGAALFRRQNGINQYIGLLKDTDQQSDNAYVGDVATATIVRNGITIT